jgi:hypothetical protein
MRNFGGKRLKNTGLTSLINAPGEGLVFLMKSNCNIILLHFLFLDGIIV